MSDVIVLGTIVIFESSFSAQGKRTETGAKKEKEISAMIKKLSRNKVSYLVLAQYYLFMGGWITEDISSVFISFEICHQAFH